MQSLKFKKLLSLILGLVLLITVSACGGNGKKKSEPKEKKTSVKETTKEEEAEKTSVEETTKEEKAEKTSIEETTKEEKAEETSDEKLAAASTKKDKDAEKDDTDEEKRVIRIGVVGEANEPWQAAKENLQDVNFEIELIRFSEYILPNAALAEGAIEMNSFQHRMFLENEISSEGYEIEEIGVTILAPLTLYSEKHEDVKDIPEKGIIAIPADPTNGGRALKLLEAAGLLTVDPEVGYLGTEADITDNPLELEILAVEASMTAQSLPDVDAAIINGHHASTHGLSPKTDGLFTERIDNDPDNPFINVIVVRSDEADDPDYKKIVEAFQQDNVAEVIEEAYKGTQIPAWPGAHSELLEDAEAAKDAEESETASERTKEEDKKDEKSAEKDKKDK